MIQGQQKTWEREVLLKSFELCDFPEGALRGCVEMTRDSEESESPTQHGESLLVI